MNLARRPRQQHAKARHGSGLDPFRRPIHAQVVWLRTKTDRGSPRSSPCNLLILPTGWPCLARNLSNYAISFFCAAMMSFAIFFIEAPCRREVRLQPYQSHPGGGGASSWQSQYQGCPLGATGVTFSVVGATACAWAAATRDADSTARKISFRVFMMNPLVCMDGVAEQACFVPLIPPPAMQDA